MAGRVVIVAGLSGAGKTTLLDRIRNRKGIRYKTVNIGTLMVAEMAKRGKPTDRDALKRLERKYWALLRIAVVKDIATMKGNIVIDTHMTIKSGEWFSPAMPYDSVKHLGGLSQIIYVDAPSKDIVRRRNADKSRQRDRISVRTIDLQRTIDMASMAYYATYLNIPLCIIENKDGGLEAAAEGLSEALFDAFK